MGWSKIHHNLFYSRTSVQNLSFVLFLQSYYCAEKTEQSQRKHRLLQMKDFAFIRRRVRLTTHQTMRTCVHLFRSLFLLIFIPGKRTFDLPRWLCVPTLSLSSCCTIWLVSLPFNPLWERVRCPFSDSVCSKSWWWLNLIIRSMWRTYWPKSRIGHSTRRFFLVLFLQWFSLPINWSAEWKRTRYIRKIWRKTNIRIYRRKKHQKLIRKVPSQWNICLRSFWISLVGFSFGSIWSYSWWWSAVWWYFIHSNFKSILFSRHFHYFQLLHH